MHLGLVISALLHLGLLGWAFVHIQSTSEVKLPLSEPVAVEMATLDDVTRLRQGERSAKQLEAEAKEAPKADPSKKEAPKPVKQAATPPPPAAEPPPPEPEVKPPEPAKPAEKDPIAEKLAALPKEQAPTPPPGPSPDEQKALEAKLEAERKAEEHKKAEAAAKKKAAEEAKKKAEDAKKKLDERKKRLEQQKKIADARRKAAEEKKKKQQAFDQAKIAELLNKIPDKGGAAPAVEKSDVASKNKGPRAGAPEGKDNRLTASEMALLIRELRACPEREYSVLSGSSERDQLIVRVKVRLNHDGGVVGTPEVLERQASAFFLAASENAVRAVMNCQPFKLPADKYDIWKEFTYRFGEKQ